MPPLLPVPSVTPISYLFLPLSSVVFVFFPLLDLFGVFFLKRDFFLFLPSSHLLEIFEAISGTAIKGPRAHPENEVKRLAIIVLSRFF